VDVYALSLKLQADGQRQVESALKSVGKNMNVTAAIAKAAGAAIGTAIVGTLALVIKNAGEAERTMAQLNATIKSTGGAAGFSSSQIARMAGDLQDVTAFGDDAIMAMQSVLLTFTKVRGDEFRTATKSILDMSTALGMDLKGAAIQVGKALNDPIAGVSALGRAGVQFTAAQKETIAALVQTGKTAEAQRIILKELETQFGGAAEAARKTLSGALKALNNAFGDMFESQAITEALRVEVEKLVNVFKDPKNIEAVQRFAVVVFGSLARSIQLLADVIHDTIALLYLFVNALASLPAPENSPLRQLRRELLSIGAGFDAVSKGAAGFTESMRTLYAEIGKQRHMGMADIPGLFSPRGGAANDGAGAGGPTVRDLGVTFTPPEMGDMWADFRKMMEDRTKASERKGRKLELTVPIEPKFDVGQFADIFQRLQQEGDELYAALEAWSSSVANSIVDAFAMSLERAAASGRLSEGWKALGAGLLGGLGTVLVDFGKKSMMASTLMKQILDGIGRFMPQASFAAGLALVALGSAMRGTASNATVFGSGRGGGGGVGFAGAGGMRFDDTFTRVTYGPTNANVAAGMEPRGAMNITVIGPNDPQAQRQIQELISKGARR
jgi:hypothetical protein